MGETPELVSEDALVEGQPSGHLDQHHHRSSWAAFACLEGSYIMLQISIHALPNLPKSPG